jgi:hypothetical protein
MGEILTATGRASEAEALLREVLEAQRQPASARSAKFASAAAALGACLVAQERFAEAESILLESHAAWTAVGGDTKAKASCAELLVGLYEKLGRPQDAERFRAPASAEH